MNKPIILALVSLFLFNLLFAQNRPTTSIIPRKYSSSTNSHISQFDITWTFDKPYQTGQFVNGDYWVLGPVTIVDISPGSTVLINGRTVNGSMLNPTPSWKQGYDSLIYGTIQDSLFDASLNVGRPNGQDLSATNPLVINNPASLVTGTSYTDHPANEPNQVHLMAVLTILNAIPPEGAFRPPFTGTDKSIRHTVTDMHYELLPKIAVPPEVTSIPDIATTSARFQKLWPDHMLNWYKERFLPKDNMPNYGRDVAGLVSTASLLLILDQDQTEKRLLALRMVQIGLDIHGLVQQPDGNVLYVANGGHDCGRVFPFVLAGYLLQDDGMLAVMKKSGQYLYSSGYYEGKPPSDYISFQELDQTFAVTQRDITRMVAGAPDSATGNWWPDTRDVPLGRVRAYDSTDMDTAEWGIEHATRPVRDNGSWGSNYRNLNTYSWVGFVLASRIMGSTFMELYNHPPLFGYIDRWMEAGYIENRKFAGNETFARAYTAFQEQMWTSLRSKY